MREFKITSTILAQELTLKEFEEYTGEDVKGSGKTKGYLVEGMEGVEHPDHEGKLSWISKKDFTGVPVASEPEKMKFIKDTLTNEVARLKEFMKTPGYIELSPLNKKFYDKRLSASENYLKVTSEALARF